MRIAMTGASGFVGRAVTAALTERGDEVAAARRGTDVAGGLRWDPRSGFTPRAALSGFDAVVHLAGESVAGGRWTQDRKQRIRDSRVFGTRGVVEAIGAADPQPRVLVSASAVGYYGDRGSDTLCESADPGTGFLADVTRAWEDEARVAEGFAGVRVVRMRLGLVLGRAGGALARMLPAFRFGLGGRLGRGDQYMSWVHIDDVAAAFLHVLDRPQTRAAYNIVAPEPVTNRAYTAALGAVLRRPAFFGVPRFALRAAFGDMADEALLAGQRVLPERLLDDGFRFQFVHLTDALEDLLG